MSAGNDLVRHKCPPYDGVDSALHTFLKLHLPLTLSSSTLLNRSSSMGIFLSASIKRDCMSLMLPLMYPFASSACSAPIKNQLALFEDRLNPVIFRHREAAIPECCQVVLIHKPCYLLGTPHLSSFFPGGHKKNKRNSK
jgi:hypothetical protein